ncbi:restriction modification system DNA specificity domain protein [Methanolacinia petrolearia DSM 11571]|uniref:Restriction modification system DNA specificity domain protein n=1 Tax=Methanolacinia petrolearia (strain DSM 11571 / OCM 486 / SEBR 4847) TaxID=679926 RepID=E1RHC4_METP4|nr:restriction endonuclease subunit S [Methanolacinia petrolearia]ADN36428.1 restriction modification system DNA specificity domain protein [Methanolacinia petrolearia DSM 11571]
MSLNKNNWEEVVLSDVLLPKGYIRGPFGSALRRNELLASGIPVYEQQHAISESRDFRFFISEEKFQSMRRFAIKTDDLIISCSGTLGKVSIIQKNDPSGIISQALLLLRVDKKKILPKYLKYFFNTKEGYNAIVSRSSGSVQVNISKRADIEQIPIRLPPLIIQTKIVDIISALDNKIELNTRMNKVLEDIAHALFHRWFVEFEFPDAEGKPYKSSGGKMVGSEMGSVPEGWESLSFKDFLKIRNEKSNDPAIPEYSVTNLGIYPRDEKYKKKLSSSSSKNKIIHKFDLVFGMSREILNWGVMKDEIGGVSSAYNVFIIDKEVNPLFLESFMKSYLPYFKDIIKPSAREGQGIDKAALFSKNIYLPPKDILDQYYDMENTILSVVRNFEKENENLIEIRDTLLPKLMSGEIEV